MSQPRGLSVEKASLTRLTVGKQTDGLTSSRGIDELMHWQRPLCEAPDNNNYALRDQQLAEYEPALLIEQDVGVSCLLKTHAEKHSHSGFYFVCDHGKQINATRYNLGVICCQGRAKQVTPFSKPNSQEHATV